MASFTITGTDTVARTLLAGEIGFIGQTGTLIVNPATAITVTGSFANIINQGTILGQVNGVFVDSTVSGISISNSGEILARNVGIYVNSAGVSNATILNSGAIRGLASGTDGIFANTGGNRVVNHGEITMLDDDAVQFFARFAEGTLTNRILNTGTMTNASGNNVISAEGDLDYVTNTGTIYGYTTLGDGNDRMMNSGEIIGDVYLDGNDDLFDGRGGTVSGTVRGGFGSDRIIGGADEDTLRGEEGNDSLYGGAGNDLISGDVGDNLVMGGAGDDDLESDLGTSTLYGGSGDDTVGVFIDELGDLMFGGTGIDTLVLDAKFTTAGVTVARAGAAVTYVQNDAPATPASTGTALQFEMMNFLGSNFADVVTGTTGTDTLRGAVGDDVADGDRLDGQAGDDVILGMNGDDTLLGGDGLDVLTGGLGRDVLTGGTGSDRFVFTTAAESPDTANRDRITDFEAGIDKIDLSGIDANIPGGPLVNEAFNFLGSAAFTGTAGELRFSVSGANIILRGDVDGDGVADFSVLILGATSVAAGDLVL